MYQKVLNWKFWCGFSEWGDVGIAFFCGVVGYASMIVLFIPGGHHHIITLFIIIINYLLTCLCVFYFVH